MQRNFQRVPKKKAKSTKKEKKETFDLSNKKSTENRAKVVELTFRNRLVIKTAVVKFQNLVEGDTLTSLNHKRE